MSENQTTKQCPYCGNEIKAIAKKCRYCGEFLPVDNPSLKANTVSNKNETIAYDVLGLCLSFVIFICAILDISADAQALYDSGNGVLLFTILSALPISIIGLCGKNKLVSRLTLGISIFNIIVAIYFMSYGLMNGASIE